MHELAAVGALVGAALTSLEAHPSVQVEAVRVRRGSAFCEDALRQGFGLLARGTPLEGARLEVEVVTSTAACPCGRSREVSVDDLIGHMHVCPACGVVQDVAGVDALELIGIAVADRSPFPASPSAP